MSNLYSTGTSTTTYIAPDYWNYNQMYYNGYYYPYNQYPSTTSNGQWTSVPVAATFSPLEDRVKELEAKLDEVLNYIAQRYLNESEEVRGHIDAGREAPDSEGVGGVSAPSPRGTWRWPAR